MGCGDCNSCSVSEIRGSGNSSVFNWLYQIEEPDVVGAGVFEVQFKGDRKDFYLNTTSLSLEVGDWVAVEVDRPGHDVGKISMKGQLVELQMKRKKRNIKKNPLKKIYRTANENDLKKQEKAIASEKNVLIEAKKIILKHKIDMKLVDVEVQADNTKATFYYTAEDRVDFRQLIKEYSRSFGVRVEMRQIGVRQEAAKIGGLGSCGRELCCSTWMTEFPSVSTNAARYQQLSINPQKISGQCGRLKCCLNFELDTYTDALKDFPSTKQVLLSEKGKAKCAKIDVFKKTMYFYYTNKPSELINLSINSVDKIIKLNDKGKKPDNIEGFETKQTPITPLQKEQSLNRFEKKNQKNKKTKKTK